MEPVEILQRTRELIKGAAGGDPDRWFYFNRFVFARLQLDERKTKTDVKKRLFESGAPCKGCGKGFDSKVDIHLHRIDPGRGYRDDNCALMHPECHRKYHTEHSERRSDERRMKPGEMIAEGILRKESKRYAENAFLYWWDITPNTSLILDNYEAVEFVKRDSGESCMVPISAIKPFLAPERQTSRGAGNWGIKVFVKRPDELAFEPKSKQFGWLFHPIVWINHLQED